MLAGAGELVEVGGGMAVELGAGIVGCVGEDVLAGAGAVAAAGGMLPSSLLRLQAVSAIDETISNPQNSGWENDSRDFMGVDLLLRWK